MPDAPPDAEPPVEELPSPPVEPPPPVEAPLPDDSVADLTDAVNGLNQILEGSSDVLVLDPDQFAVLVVALGLLIFFAAASFVALLRR